MSDYNTNLQQNNAELEELIALAEALPDANTGGGGEKPWKYEKQIVFTEDTAGFTIDAYDDGTPFDFTEIEVSVALKNAGAAANWGDVSVWHDGVNLNSVTGQGLALGGNNALVSAHTAVGQYYMCTLKGYIENGYGAYAEIARGAASVYLNSSYVFSQGITLNVPNYSYNSTASLNSWRVKPTKFTRVTSAMTIGANSTIIVRGR